MASLHHLETLLCLFARLFCASLLASFMCIPQNVFQYTHFDVADLHDSPQGHFNVDNGTQGFACIDACCWIELVSG